MSKTTLKDIAAAAGVSMTTVSRVLNGKNAQIPISERTRERIVEIADRLDYHPNIHARALASNTTNTISLVLEDILDPFYNEVISGIERAASDLGLNLTLSITGSRSLKEIVEVTYRKSAPDGIIICGSQRDPAEAEIYRSYEDLPLVSVCHTLPEIPSVDVDNRRGGYVATDYLASLGHGSIAIIRGPDDLDNATERYEGYVEALSEHGIAHGPALEAKGEFSYESGYQAMSQLLGAGQPRAVFASDDYMALGAISSVMDHELRVPDDVSIIGFDNLVQSNFSVPKLTTIESPRVRMGIDAVDLLMKHIRGEDSHTERILLEPKLVERESCRRADLAKVR